MSIEDREIDLVGEAVYEYCFSLKEKGFLDWIHPDDIELLADRAVEALEEYRIRHWKGRRLNDGVSCDCKHMHDKIDCDRSCK